MLHQCKVAALQSGIFWLHCCAMGRRGEIWSVFIYINDHKLRRRKDIIRFHFSHFNMSPVSLLLMSFLRIHRTFWEENTDMYFSERKTIL